METIEYKYDFTVAGPDIYKLLTGVNIVKIIYMSYQDRRKYMQEMNLSPHNHLLLSATFNRWIRMCIFWNRE